VIVAARAVLADVFASRVHEDARAAIAARGRFTMALTGGGSASALYPRLVDVELDWPRTHLFWGDERAVAPDSPDSNVRLAMEAWLGPTGAPAASVHRMRGDEADLQRAAAEYARELAGVAGEPPVLDLVHLGVGPDGHVASLFPGHPLLEERAATVAAVLDSPKPPPARLTLTLPVLCAARLVVLTPMGADKAEVIARALSDPECALPVARVLRGASRVLLLLDPEAGSGMVRGAHTTKNV